MKLPLRYASTTLRAVLLLGVLVFANIQPTAAQTAEQRAEMPDAFETMDPATIIGDGNYYYIQFYDGNMRSYLTDCGLNTEALTKDFVPYANNRLWTLVPAGDGNATHFKLKNREGRYIKYARYGNRPARLGCVEDFADATILLYTSLGTAVSDGYDIARAVNEYYPFYRPGNAEWTTIAEQGSTRRAANYYLSRLRFVKLKSNSAFIIYYRGEEKTDPVGNSNSNAATTRHYLTYSGTASSSLGENWWSSDVSSQQSIIPADKPLPSLPTLAAYHKDGLWTIEEADVNGQFYIKKYGTNQYLNEHNHSDIYDCELSGRDATKGTYTVEDPSANRYTRVQNVKYTTEQLTAGMFYNWDGYGADANRTESANLSLYYGTQESPLNGGDLVAGTGGVWCYTYADLSEYSKMTINGTQGMQLRVLMNRQESDSGPYAEKNVTIGSDGTAVVDLTDLEINRKYAWPTVKMTYVNYNDPDASYGGGDNGIEWGETAISGYNTISNGKVTFPNSGWGVSYITYLQVDASAISGNILKATLKADVSGPTDNGSRNAVYGVGYNNSTWTSGMTFNTADINITPIGSTVSNTTRNKDRFVNGEFDITQAFTNDADADNIVTLLVYETAAAGGYIKNPVVEILYEPTVKEKVSYAHLNAIKRDYGGETGTINSISLAKVNNTDARYLHHADGDGWQVLQWSGTDDNNNWWYAGFYPVEVVDKDEFYNVLLKDGDQIVGVSNDQAVSKTYNSFNPELWALEQDEDYQDFTLQSWNGKYYSGGGIGSSLTANPTEISNSHINSTFSTIEWLPNTETRIVHDVTHKVSNVRLYYDFNPTSSEEQNVLSQQGLITDADSEWWDAETGTQKVNEFKITHYVKRGDIVTFGLPTVLTVNNDHRLFQRWYKYGEDTNLEDLKNHFRLKVDNQEVMSYLYNNGIVTGQKLDWNVIFPGALTFELNKLTYYNCDGQTFTLAADVSRYSDFTYQNTNSHLDGDLEEPSLTMRYLFEMHDAEEMATALMACTGDKWLEKEKEIHFPATRLQYESGKAAEFQGEFIGIRHQFKDYWVFDDDGNLVSAVTNNTSGNIEVVCDDGGTGIALAGYNNLGFYCYRERSTSPYVYGDSRFVAFKYPDSGTVPTDETTGKSVPAYLYVYFNNNGTRYQIARFKLIFDKASTTLPWTSVNGSAQVKDSDRDPNKLEQKAGKPIAKITFDYPDRINTGDGLPSTFKNSSDYTIHNRNVMEGLWSRIENSSPLPLTFDNTNYGFDGDNPSWGSYAMVSTMQTVNGRNNTAMPANDADYGYNIGPDEGMKSAFFYVDASEQPGDICAIPFTGEFCSGDKLMCTGWISGSNRLGASQSAGSVTITVKGERMENGQKVTDDIYRFCPGQCYELDNGTGIDGSTNATHVVWQQFYFDFQIHRKYLRQWVEVNNNCVSSMGGDFMLDNIEVYAMVPEVNVDMNTPICVDHDASELQLLKLTVGFEKLITATGINENAQGNSDHSFGLVFLDKQKFLKKFQEGLLTYNNITATLAEVEQGVEAETYHNIVDVAADGGYKEAYEAAFDYALLGDHTAIWDSNNPETNAGQGVLNFHWNDDFTQMTPYTFTAAVNRTSPIYGYTDTDTGERLLVLNGNFPYLPWKTLTDYYVITYNDGITNISRRYQDFNICSECNHAKVFQVKPPYHIISTESYDETEEVEVCEGKIPTLLTDLHGYDYNGNLVTLQGINFDWWLGDPANGLVATLDNFHQQHFGDVYLDQAIGNLRAIYPDATTLEGLVPKNLLTQEMLSYLQELVDKGQLILHQSSISIPAEKTSDEDPYAYLVACPIHDGYFDQALNHDKKNDVAYFCDEPQGVRVKVGEKAPTLKTGFVPGENGFTAYNYPADDPILSIRLAKRAQFETVQHGESTETPVSNPATAATDLHFLWLPVRDAQTQTADRVIRKADDYNIYLASTNDPVWDKNIYTSMKNGVLPIVGKIVSLYAKNTYAEDPDEAATLIAAQNAVNRLCVYFTENFEVREGYTYTLSLPFQEEGDVNTCDGTMLINLKIVPDYEVWTGGADNTDWNNDQNWRRADGNLGTSTEEPSQGAGRNNNELLVSNTLPEESGLYQYKTNFWNYRTAKDRLLRKGFAPLYCTHILMKANEWGDAPVLYDALNGKDDLEAYPFPNLNESYTVNTAVDERFKTIDALNGQTFAIYNEATGMAIYGTDNQNLGYGSYNDAVQETNSGYYYKLISEAGHYLLRLQTPAREDYSIWGKPGYLNSQPLNGGTVSFILGLAGQYGEDGANLALWDLISDGNGKFALKNVGTGKYLKDNSVAKYDNPTYFTFCTLKDPEIPTEQQRYNILKFDMQARVYDIWSDTYGSNPDRGRAGDLIAEMYQINSCDEIAFQPSAELLNAHLLNYNNAWVEYQLDNERWYLLGSSLQGTVAGEWYSPTGTAQQKTTYYEPVTFGAGYDRYSPAIYQRSWDKAKAVLYEVGSTYSTSDDSQTENLGNDDEGVWTDGTWTVPGGGTADQYLDRLGYKPMGGKKANVAIKGVWSNTYNDATVDYANGGFSVMVKNALKNNDQSDGKALIRLPKEDTMYDYYKFEETGQADGGTDTDLGTVQTVKNRALNRGRLKSDLLLPTSNTSLPVYQQIQRTETAASRYGDQRTYTRVPTQKGTDALPMTLQEMQETVATGVSDMGYYLVENPFQTGLDMETFFAENTQLLPKYWIMTPAGQQLVYRAADGTWVTQTGEPTAAFAAADAKLAPGQGFFVQKDPGTTDDAPNTILFNADMQAKTRYGVKSGEETFTIVVGTKQKMTTKPVTFDDDDNPDTPEVPVKVDDDNNPETPDVQATVEVPVVDDSGNYVLEDITETVTISTYVQATGDGQQFPLRARLGGGLDTLTRGGDDDLADASSDGPTGLVITARRDTLSSSALVTLRPDASDDFLPTEDTETFISMDELRQVPMVYTLCGRLATTVNSIREFRSLPLGVESASDAPCVLTFEGVEQLGDSIAFYDAKEQELTPLESGMTFRVSGRTQNRYYLVSTLIKEEAAAETHVQIFVQGLTARVIASTDKPLVNVRCYDTAGRLVHAANPQTSEYSFTLPSAGVYIIEGHTADDHKTIKVIAK